MARTELTVETIDIDGAFRAAVAGDVANGNMFDNAGGVLVIAENTDGANPHTVTIVTPKQVGGLDIEDPVVTVAASATALIGPFPSGTFNQPSGADAGKVYLDVDDALVTLTVYRLP